jgi:sterol desaturase/sphingolipid hydroxylase (fatty acid hydroxylase superfamily)
MHLRTLLAPLAVVGLVAVSLVIDAAALRVVPLLFVFVVPFEKLFPRHRNQRVRRPGLVTDLTYAAVAPVLGVVSVIGGIAIGVLSLAWIPGLVLRPMVTALPPIASALLAVVLFDLAIYWGHRWSHEVPALWKFHAVHHSARTMDWISGIRVHPFDGAIIAPAFVLLVAAGFDPEITGVLAVVQVLSGIFLHANVRWRLRPLHRIVSTPEFHHWHHANEVDAHNSNYAGFLPVWDIIFGTYHMPKRIRPMVYGVDEAIPGDLLGQLAAPFSRGLDIRSAFRHPVLIIQRGLTSLRGLLGDVVRSTTRPRRLAVADGDPWRWTSTRPCQERAGNEASMSA